LGLALHFPIRPTLGLDVSSSEWPEVAQQQLEGLGKAGLAVT